VAHSKRHTGKETSVAHRDRTLSDMIYEAILARIVDGEFAIGGKLPTEHALSEQLKVSRPVLRQALKQLRADGAITSRQGSGSYVNGQPDRAIMRFAPVGSIADIQRTFEFRAAIEGDAAYLAAQRRSTTQLQALRDAFQKLEICVQNGHLGVDEDEDFHAHICQASDNPYFSAVRQSIQHNIRTGMILNRNLSLTKPGDRPHLVQSEHKRIFEAVKNQNADEARTAMRAHIENARRRVFESSPQNTDATL
jgi:GntR family transcriptional regulator, transcriptional repressor for pyruvate dehydrogenase complex